MNRPFMVAFISKDGSVHELKDPHGQPTGRQLLWLNAHGLLDLRDQPGIPIAKGSAAAAIDQARHGEKAA